ncbi:hypothetical protein [Moorena bouillonii]|nr:hypothetical protein [Moorena bouillonii]
MAYWPRFANNLKPHNLKPHNLGQRPRYANNLLTFNLQPSTFNPITFFD